MGGPDKPPMDERDVKAMGSIHGLFFALLRSKINRKRPNISKGGIDLWLDRWRVLKSLKSLCFNKDP